jgi:hypothetical protein
MCYEFDTLCTFYFKQRNLSNRITINQNNKNQPLTFHESTVLSALNHSRLKANKFFNITVCSKLSRNLRTNNR